MERKILLSGISLLLFFITFPLFSYCEEEKKAFDYATTKINNIQAEIKVIEDKFRQELKQKGADESYIISNITNGLSSIIGYEEHDVLKKSLGIANDEHKEAENKYYKCIEVESKKEVIDSTELKNLTNEGYNYYIRGDYVSAINIYEEVYRKAPNNSDVKNALVLVYKARSEGLFAKLEVDKAIEIGLKVLDISPKDFEGNFNLGVMYEYKKDYEEALKYYEKAYEYSFKSEDIKSSQDKVDKIKAIIYGTDEEVSGSINDIPLKNNLDINQIQNKTEIAFTLIKDSLSKKSQSNQKIIFVGLSNELNKVKNNYAGEKEIIIEYLIELINNEINQK